MMIQVAASESWQTMHCIYSLKDSESGPIDDHEEALFVQHDSPFARILDSQAQCFGRGISSVLAYLRPRLALTKHELSTLPVFSADAITWHLTTLDIVNCYYCTGSRQFGFPQGGGPRYSC